MPTRPAGDHAMRSPAEIRPTSALGAEAGSRYPRATRPHTAASARARLTAPTPALASNPPSRTRGCQPP